MEKLQYGTIRIGQIVSLFNDGIGFDALTDGYNPSETDRLETMIKRLKKEKDVKIDKLRDFEKLIKDFCKNCLKQGFINKKHTYIIQSLYFDLLSLIKNTNPYNNPTYKEVELQIMYCLALILREIFDSFIRENKTKSEAFVLTLSLYNFWQNTQYKKNVKLIPACFDYIFSEIKNPKKDLFDYWDKMTNDYNATGLYSKEIYDWTKQNVKPTWKKIKLILTSDIPEGIIFKTSNSSYQIFKWNLFIGNFISKFFRSLEKQKLVSKDFKNTVQDGFRYFYSHFFNNEGNTSYCEDYEMQNPMFSLLRLMVYPSEINRSCISDSIYEAFFKELMIAPSENRLYKSLYYIPEEINKVPFLDYKELSKELYIYDCVSSTINELSTIEGCGIFEDKLITEEELDKVLLHPDMGECKSFYYPWLKGKYHVLCHDFETGLELYKEAFPYRYYGGASLPLYLEEFLVLIKKCDCKKPEFNKIHEWANAICIYLNEIDKDRQNYLTIRSSFEEVFPEKAFIK